MKGRVRMVLAVLVMQYEVYAKSLVAGLAIEDYNV